MTLLCRYGALVIVFFIRSSSSKRPPRLVTVPDVAATNNDTHAASNITILDNIDGHRRGYLVNVSSSDIFTVQRPATKSLAVVSQQAVEHGCNIAINGGPFQTNGDCVGGVVMDGKVVMNDFQETNVGFGITFTREWILGGIKNASEATTLQVEHYVTGFDWLVYDGEVAVQHEEDLHLRHHDRAPRTAIGVTETGHLLLLVVDGCEACLRHRGLTWEELATLFQSHGVHHAINLDGGSSTTLLQDFQVLNVPTCHDVPWKCERPVATIVCLQQQHRDSDDFQEEEEAQ